MKTINKGRNSQTMFTAKHLNVNDVFTFHEVRTVMEMLFFIQTQHCLIRKHQYSLKRRKENLNRAMKNIGGWGDE